MTLEERRSHELERLRQLREMSRALVRDMERLVGRINLIDELLKEGDDAPIPEGADAPE